MKNDLRHLIRARLDGDWAMAAICCGDECRCGHRVWVAVEEHDRLQSWEWHCIWCARPHPHAHHKRGPAPGSMRPEGFDIVLRHITDVNARRMIESIQSLVIDGSISVSQTEDGFLIYAMRDINFPGAKGQDFISIRAGERLKIAISYFGEATGKPIKRGGPDHHAGTRRGGLDPYSPRDIWLLDTDDDPI